MFKWHSALVATVMTVTTVLVACGDDGVGDPVKDHSVYTIVSTFDVKGDFGNSGLGDVLNLLNRMSDHDDDPGRAVVEWVIDGLPTPAQWALEAFEDELAGEVNDVIMATVPTAAEEAKAIAKAVSEAARKFKISSRLEVGLDSEDRFTGKHELLQIEYAYEGKTLTIEASELGDRVTPAVRIPIQIDDPKLTIPNHFVQVPIGTALSKAIDGLIIPTVLQKPMALADLISRWFSCAKIAAAISIKSAALVDSAVLKGCFGSAQSVADRLKAKLVALDKYGGLRLSGSADAESDKTTYGDSGWSGGYKVAEETVAPLDPSNDRFSMSINDIH